MKIYSGGIKSGKLNVQFRETKLMASHIIIITFLEVKCRKIYYYLFSLQKNFCFTQICAFFLLLTKSTDKQWKLS